MNVWLKVADGIKYKGDPKPKYKGKLFFHRFYIAVNREAEKHGLFDFSTNAQNQPTDFWKPSGGAFGEYNEFMKALGYKTDGSVRNNKQFRSDLVGKFIVYDITKEPKEEYDKATRKRKRLPGEYENFLRGGRSAAAAGAGTAGSGKPGTPAAAAGDTPDWET
jgi:hypothetical protein